MLYSQVGKTAIMNGQTLKSTGLSDAGPVFIPLPGGETAIYNSSGTLANYRHADWLGSSRLTTTTSRTVYSSTAYAPSGEQYATSGTADASFTGQNSDTNSGLYDFTFREYSPSQGRWVSPDPAGVAAADPTSPQSWNRYAYVQNQQMNYVDPLGLKKIPCPDPPPPPYVDEDGNIIYPVVACDDGTPPPGTPSPCYADASCQSPQQPGQQPTSGPGGGSGSGGGAPNNGKQNPCGTSCHSPNKPLSPPSKSTQPLCPVIGDIGWGAGGIMGPWMSFETGLFGWIFGGELGAYDHFNCH
jgi:RHS repeat-associated protein